MSDPADSVAQPPVPGPETAETPGPAAGDAQAPQPEAAASPDATGPDAPPEPKPETLLDAIADLMQMAVNYLRQETAGVMRDKVVLPGQQLGMFVAFALAAAFLLALGVGFIAVAVLLVLAMLLGWPGALTLVGALLIAGAGLFTYLKVRSLQS